MTASNLDAEFLFRTRFADLSAGLDPILEWARREKGYVPSKDGFRLASSLSGLAGIVARRSLRVPVQSPEECLDLSAMPAHLTGPIRRYLCDLPGWDPSRPVEAQPGIVAQQHDYVLFFGDAASRQAS